MPDIQLHSDSKAAKDAVKNDYQAALDDITTNWAGFTQAQKAEALRTALIVCMKAIKYIMKRI